MKLFDRIKEIFGDEEEIIEPVKTNKIQVEISNPKESSVVVEQIIKADDKPRTLFFDDEDFKTIEDTKPVFKPTPKIEIKKEPIRIFKATPIISPVYGILDTNYRKEDIKTSNKLAVARANKLSTIDEVRKKAYGTLEDTLVDDLFPDTEEVLNKTEVLNFSQDLFSDLEESDAKKEVELDYIANIPKKETSEIELDYIATIPKKEVDEVELDYIASIPKVEQPEEVQEDLFNLIDSLYDKEEQE